MALVNYWKLNGDANDSVGSQNGTVQGADSAAYSLVNGCYNFVKTSSDYIDLGTYTIPTAFTLSCLINMTTLPATSGADRMYTMLGGYKSSTTNELEVFIIDNYDGVGQLLQWSQDAARAHTKYQYFNYTFSAGVNYHIVVSQANGGAVSSVYINGVPVAQTSQSGSGTVLREAMPYSIGKYGDASSNPRCFNGLIDEIKIFNAVLPVADVKNLYAAYRGMF